jgi:hypothetical protein
MVRPCRVETEEKQLKGEVMFTDRRSTPRATGVVILALAFGLTACAYGFAGGTGEPNDPYQVATIEDLLAIGSSKDLLSKHYVLVNDLDLDPNLPVDGCFWDEEVAGTEFSSGQGRQYPEIGLDIA